MRVDRKEGCYHSDEKDHFKRDHMMLKNENAKGKDDKIDLTAMRDLIIATTKAEKPCGLCHDIRWILDTGALYHATS